MLIALNRFNDLYFDRSILPHVVCGYFNSVTKQIPDHWKANCQLAVSFPAEEVTIAAEQPVHCSIVKKYGSR